MADLDRRFAVQLDALECALHAAQHEPQESRTAALGAVERGTAALRRDHAASLGGRRELRLIQGELSRPANRRPGNAHDRWWTRIAVAAATLVAAAVLAIGALVAPDAQDELSPDAVPPPSPAALTPGPHGQVPLPARRAPARPRRVSAAVPVSAGRQYDVAAHIAAATSAAQAPSADQDARPAPSPRPTRAISGPSAAPSPPLTTAVGTSSGACLKLALGRVHAAACVG